jgi:hypothetical protein
LRTLKGIEHLGDVGADVSIILKLILEKQRGLGSSGELSMNAIMELQVS